jgi:DNA mismatch endonuclease Vsr
MDTLTKDQRKKTMQAVKSTNSKIEKKLATELWKKGFRYRKNVKSIFGKPDIVFLKIRLAVFVDSEFWHGKNWEKHKNDHKSNIEYWHKKIERNMARDRLVNKKLRKEGWTVLRFWGIKIEKNIDICLNKIIVKIEELNDLQNN